MPAIGNMNQQPNYNSMNFDGTGKLTSYYAGANKFATATYRLPTFQFPLLRTAINNLHLSSFALIRLKTTRCILFF